MEHLQPSFFIIGVNKCGTSSLYRYLVAHPSVLPCALKEPNFFGRHSSEYVASHMGEYFALFPPRDYRGALAFRWEASDRAGMSSLTKIEVKRDPARQYITGEASANTFHDVAPALLRRHLPDIKLIVLLRDPVERAYSHYRMYERFEAAGHRTGLAMRDFANDVAAELRAGGRSEPADYLAAGVYVDRLEQWLEQYGWGQSRVIITEDLARPDTARRVMRELEDYLGLPRHDYGEMLSRRFNHATPSEMTPPVRARLATFYREPNRRLRDLLRRDLPWE